MGSGWYSGSHINGTVTWWTGNYSAETFEAQEYYYGLGDYYEEDPDLWEHWDKYRIRHRVRDAILKMPTDKAWEYIIEIDSHDGAISEEENEAWETALANKDLEAAVQNLIIERGYINEGWGTGIINELKDHNYYRAESNIKTFKCGLCWAELPVNLLMDGDLVADKFGMGVAHMCHPCYYRVDIDESDELMDYNSKIPQYQKPWSESCSICGEDPDHICFEAPSYGNYYGACLLPDGSCTETSLEMCRALGGNFQGPGTSCYADAGWAKPRVMRAESSKGLGKGLTIGIVAGIISGLVTTVFGTVISEILLDRLREDPELEITDEEVDSTNTP